MRASSSLRKQTMLVRVPIFLYVAQAVECVLAVAFGKNYVGSSPTIGIFLYVAQAVECVLAVAFRNKLCCFESHYRHISLCSPGSWTRASSSLWNHTTITKDRHPCPRWDSNPHYQQARGRRLPGNGDRRSIAPMHKKWKLILYPLKGLFSEIYLFNKKFRTLLLRPLISFVMSWTQSVIERNAEMKQLHPTRLTQGPIAHRYFWEGGQARFPALSFSPHSTYSRWGSYQALAVASQEVWRWPATVAVLAPHENHGWRSGLAVNGLYHRDKASVQRARLRCSKCADNHCHWVTTQLQ